jgi:protein-S-isoprenylcysteine O-methyltransferase Ste14
MGFMLLAHWLYSNATAKGEHCVPCTWDMFHENFGWMLNFWNICGVPFLYCFQSLYILKNQTLIAKNYPLALTIFDFALLLLGYYIFDTANCQKATIKHNLRRNTFPQLPWSVLEEPIRYIVTPKGKLLVDGWYAFGRKMQYTGDIMMATSWGLACGFNSLLPFFYALFFTCMIIHRQTRDEVRCKEKYGAHWDLYTKTVPNVFLPSGAFFTYLFTGVHPGGKVVGSSTEITPLDGQTQSGVTLAASLSTDSIASNYIKAGTPLKSALKVSSSSPAAVRTPPASPKKTATISSDAHKTPVKKHTAAPSTDRVTRSAQKVTRSANKF